MNWQIPLYFVSILVTCVLTGGLVAWRQASRQGARTFAALSASGSLLALVQAVENAYFRCQSWRRE